MKVTSNLHGSIKSNPNGSITVVITPEGGEPIAIQIAVDRDYARLTTPMGDGVKGVLAFNLDCCDDTEMQVLMLRVMVPPP